MEGKIRMVGFERAEIILVEDFLARAGPVPITDFACALFRFQQVRKMRAQGSHARAAADVHHFMLRGLDVEVAEGADGCNRITPFQIEYVARARAGSAVLPRRG